MSKTSPEAMTTTREERRALRDRLVAIMPHHEGLINYHVGQTLALIGPVRFRSIATQVSRPGVAGSRSANTRVLVAIAAELDAMVVG